MAKDLGYSDQQFITPDSDSAVSFYANGKVDIDFHVSLRKVLIDGLGIGDVGTTVLRDRKLLAEEGLFSIVLLVEKETGHLFKDPIILSRGFVFMKENTDLINYLKEEATKKFREVSSSPANFDYIREEVQAHLETVIHDKTGREPMVLPLVIEV